MTVTATVQGGAVAVVAPRPVVVSPPAGTQSFVPRTSSSGVVSAPAIQPVAPRASSPSNVTPPPPPPPVVAPVMPVDATAHIEEAVIVPPTPPPPPAPAEANTSAPPAAKPRAGVDLAEIDRYLEGLGKL